MTMSAPKFTRTSVHEEALARCEFLIEGGRSWGLLTGPAGTGKSMLLRQLRTRANRFLGASTICVEATAADGKAFLSEVATGLGLGPIGGETHQLLAAIRDRLEGDRQCERRRLLLVDHLDEARDCVLPVLTHLLRTAGARGALTVIAAARSSLADGLRSLEEDFGTVRIELPPLAEEAADVYVRETLRRFGRHERSLEPGAEESLQQLSGGRPRQIDRMCELALLAQQLEAAEGVSREVIEAAVLELPGVAVGVSR